MEEETNSFLKRGSRVEIIMRKPIQPPPIFVIRLTLEEAKELTNGLNTSSYSYNLYQDLRNALDKF